MYNRSNMQKSSKFPKSSIVLIVVILSIVFGLISGLLTDRFIVRSDNFFIDKCRGIQSYSNPKINCNKVYVGSRGWPFPSTSLYSDGSKREIVAKEVYCLGCVETKLGSQIIYNGIILAIAYMVLVSLIYIIVKVVRK